MKEGLRRFFTAFCLTVLLALTAAGGLVAYDRMERTLNGAPQVSENELLLGSRVYPFDLEPAVGLLSRFSEAARYAGGLPALFSLMLGGISEQGSQTFAGLAG